MPSTAETVETYFAAVSRRDLDAMVATWEPGGQACIVGVADMTAPEGNRQWFGDLFQAFPDFSLEVKRIVTEGDTAVVHWLARASFSGTGSFEGLKPNGARVEMEGIDLVEVADGRIHSIVAILNGMDLARQLGAMPPRGSAADKALAGAFNARTAVTAKIGELRDRG